MADKGKQVLPGRVHKDGSHNFRRKPDKAIQAHSKVDSAARSLFRIKCAPNAVNATTTSRKIAENSPSDVMVQSTKEA